MGSKESTESTGSCLAALAAAPVVLIISAVLHGTVLSIIWGWFIVPVFHAPPLSIAAAIGLGLVVSYLTSQQSGKDERRALEVLFTSLLRAVIEAAIVLLFGFIVHLFV